MEKPRAVPLPEGRERHRAEGASGAASHVASYVAGYYVAGYVVGCFLGYVFLGYVANYVAGYLGTRATQKTVCPNGGRTKRSMRRVRGTTVRS